MPQPHLFSLIDKAIYDYAMLPPGCKILVGASGGKDSTLLVEYLANRLRRFPSPERREFSFSAICFQTDFAPPFSTELKRLFAGWGVDVIERRVDVLGRLKPGRRMNCYWCSTQRRTELIRYAVAHGYDTIALGHHLDDILETLLMNMLGAGTLSAMPPVLRYRKYPLRVIRPLCYAPVRQIALHAEQSGWQNMTCTCGCQDNSGRKEMRRRLDALTAGDERAKIRLFTALKHINAEYLP